MQNRILAVLMVGKYFLSQPHYRIVLLAVLMEKHFPVHSNGRFSLLQNIYGETGSLRWSSTDHRQD